MQRLLCRLGLHTQGIRTAGCRYDINRCRWCRRDVWFVFRATTL